MAKKERKQRNLFKTSLGNYAEWLMQRRVPHTKKRQSLAQVRSKFGNCIDLWVLKALSLGEHVPSDEVRKFGRLLDINIIDTAELFIRWGEADLGRYSYQCSDRAVRQFLKYYEIDRQAALLSLKIREHRLTNNTLPRGDLIDGLARYQQTLKLTDSSFRPFVVRNTVVNLRELGEVTGRTLTKLLNESLFLRVSEGMDEKTKASLELTRQRMCAHFIEVKIEARLLSFSHRDLLDCFEPDYHARLMHWLLSSDLRTH